MHGPVTTTLQGEKGWDKEGDRRERQSARYVGRNGGAKASEWMVW